MQSAASRRGTGASHNAGTLLQDKAALVLLEQANLRGQSKVECRLPPLTGPDAIEAKPSRNQPHMRVRARHLAARRRPSGPDGPPLATRAASMKLRGAKMHFRRPIAWALMIAAFGAVHTA